jgi:hypothetical protein
VPLQPDKAADTGSAYIRSKAARLRPRLELGPRDHRAKISATRPKTKKQKTCKKPKKLQESKQGKNKPWKKGIMKQLNRMLLIATLLIGATFTALLISPVMAALDYLLTK